MIRRRTGLVLLIGMVLSACASPTPAPTAATAAPISTRLLAEMSGTVSLDDGCLRVGDRVLVWPPDYSVTVDGDRVEISDAFTGETAVWREGDTVGLMGAEISRTNISAEAGQRWYGTCEGANNYWLVGGIGVAIPATSTRPVTRTPAASAAATGETLPQGCVPEAAPDLVTGLPTSNLHPGWKHYTESSYGFTIDFPSDWWLRPAKHFLCLEPQADPGIVLIIGFRAPSEGTTIQRTGVGAGDIVTRGTVVILGQEVTRDVLVYQGQDKSVLYNLAREIKSLPLVVTISLDFHDARNYQGPAVSLPSAVQATADQIVASLAFDHAAPSDTSAPAVSATDPLPPTTTRPAPTASLAPSATRPLPATSTPIPQTPTPPPTATMPPTACAHAWFLAHPPSGCPDQPAIYAHTIAQRFERGLLLWRAVPDTYGSQIYAFFDDGQWPAWNPTNDRWRPGLPESDPAIVPPAGFYQPVRGFGLFWREANFVPAGTARDRLGWALGPEHGLGERPLQCRFQGDWAAGCFLGGPGDQVLLVEGNNAWSVWTGPAP